MPLSELVISGKELDENLLTEVLRGYVQFVEEDKTILITPETKKRPLRDQILIYLLARKALRRVFPTDGINETVATSEIAGVLGEDQKTVSARLSELRGASTVKKHEDGNYLLSDSLASVVAYELKKSISPGTLGESPGAGEQLEKRVESEGVNGSGISLPLPIENEPRGKEVSVGEFLRSKGPENGVQKTLAIGYYLEKYRKFDSFNIKDLSGGFREAREPLPSNINDKINKNIKNGHAMETGSKKDNQKAWVLTTSGEAHVEKGFGSGDA